MGNCFSCCSFSGGLQPSTPDEKANFKGPVKGRSCTDVSCLIFFIFALISLFGLVIYCTVHGDVNRLFYGYDECGNICGFKNDKNSNSKFCTGEDDVSDKPFLWINTPIYEAADLKYVERKCVKNCDLKEYRQFLHRCAPKSNGSSNNDQLFDLTINRFVLEVTQDLEHTKSDIILLCLFAFISSLLLVFLMRFIAGFVVLFVFIGIILVSFTATICLWITWKQKSNFEFQSQAVQGDANTYFAFALIASVFTVIILLVIVAMRKRITLVVQLFKEAGKAIQSMPLLLVQPIITFFFLCLAIIVWSYFAIIIQSSGLPMLEQKTQTVYYKKDQLMKFAILYNMLVSFWIIEFIIACQHMIIAGSVATWFFTRNKDNLSSPISTSAGYLFKYHLGSVALGTFIITLCQVIKIILNKIGKCLKKSENRFVKSAYRVFKCVFNYLGQFLQYLTRNAFIEIAIYGDNFCSSGQQAFKILTSNVLRVVAINSVGDFVLFLGKLLVVIITVLLGFTMLENKPGVLRLWVPLAVAGTFAYFVAHCFISVFEMVIDTIFICFCEDCSINDGVTQEYYMSKGLRNFVESNQKELRVGDGATN